MIPLGVLSAVGPKPRRVGFWAQVEMPFLTLAYRRLFLLGYFLLPERHNVVTYLQDSLVNVGT
jgi:hypothetical protein